MKRATTKRNSKMVNVWLPESLIAVIDTAVVEQDTDRSKFIRQAIREKTARVLPAAATASK